MLVQIPESAKANSRQLNIDIDHIDSLADLERLKIDPRDLGLAEKDAIMKKIMKTFDCQSRGGC